MPLRDHRMAIDVAGAFYNPICAVFPLETAGIADKFLHLVVFIFTGRYAVYILAIHPDDGLTAAFVAIAVRIHWIEEPYAAFESERPVGQGAYGAYVDDIAGKVVVDGLFNERADFCVIAAIDNAMHPLFGELIGYKYAAIAHDATRHMQFDIGADVYFFKGTTLKLVARARMTVFEGKVLQMAFARLVANGAIERMVEQEKFYDAGAGIGNGRIAFAGHFHAVHDHRLA